MCNYWECWERLTINKGCQEHKEIIVNMSLRTVERSLKIFFVSDDLRPLQLRRTLKICRKCLSKMVLPILETHTAIRSLWIESGYMERIVTYDGFYETLYRFQFESTVSL